MELGSEILTKIPKIFFSLEYIRLVNIINGAHFEASSLVKLAVIAPRDFVFCLHLLRIWQLSRIWLFISYSLSPARQSRSTIFLSLSESMIKTLFNDFVRVIASYNAFFPQNIAMRVAVRPPFCLRSAHDHMTQSANQRAA